MRKSSEKKEKKTIGNNHLPATYVYDSISATISNILTSSKAEQSPEFGKTPPVKIILYNSLVYKYDSKNTTGITVFYAKKCAENLQVENPDIMFVSDLNTLRRQKNPIPLIRT